MLHFESNLSEHWQLQAIVSLLTGVHNHSMKAAVTESQIWRLNRRRTSQWSAVETEMVTDELFGILLMYRSVYQAACEGRADVSGAKNNTTYV